MRTKLGVPSQLALVHFLVYATLHGIMKFAYWILLSLLAANVLAGPADENWETFPIPKGLNGGVAYLLPYQDMLYAAGDFTEADGHEARGIAAWDGSHWSPVGHGLEGAVVALATDGRNLYAGGEFVIPKLAITNLAMWDGNRWHPVGNVIKRTPLCSPGSVYALACHGDRLFVGGAFDMVANLPATNIAVLHGKRWETLGIGIGGGCDDSGVGDVYSIAASEEGVYAGGLFHRAGTATATNIARWDGAKWENLASGLASGSFERVNYEHGERVFYSGAVYALEFVGNHLVAGGDFQLAGDKSVRGLAHWDGHSWSERFGPIDGTVRAISLHDSSMFVAGTFPHAGKIAANNVARFDGHHWSALDSGMSDSAYVLRRWHGDLFVAGEFGIAGEKQSPFIARWSDARWRPLHSGSGAGVFGYVTGIADSDTDLCIAGVITSAGDERIQNVASWNGTTWANLGTGLWGFPQSAARVGSNVYIAGSIAIPSIGATNIARWDGRRWNPVPLPDPSRPFSIIALAADDQNLYAISSGPESTVLSWDGQQWSQLGESFSGSLFYIAASKGRVAVSGYFYRFGNQPGGGVAVWDGSMWSPLGDFVPSNGPGRVAFAGDAIFVIAYDSLPWLWTVKQWNAGDDWSTIATVTGSGSFNDIGGNDHFLYLAGSFDHIGGVEAKNIARFDGLNWSPLGSGLDGEAYPISVSKNRVVVGGQFTKAGDRSSYHLAVWHEEER